jgi:hypothetical protein
MNNTTLTAIGRFIHVDISLRKKDQNFDQIMSVKYELPIFISEIQIFIFL